MKIDFPTADQIRAERERSGDGMQACRKRLCRDAMLKALEQRPNVDPVIREILQTDRFVRIKTNKILYQIKSAGMIRRFLYIMPLTYGRP